MAETAESVERHSGRARAGRSDRDGRDYDPAAMMAAAAPAAPEVQLPRPARTRYPIPAAEFAELKTEAAQPEPRVLHKPASAIVQDRGQPQPELAAAPAAAAPAGFAPPAAAPAPVGNFKGIPHTNWLPFDGTMAVGPDHVLASVNSSVAVFAKAGGPPLLQRTLSAWFSNVVPAGATVFDPKALFDQHAGRWVLLAVALTENPNRSWFVFSVSKSGSPLGAWWNYALDAAKDGTTATSNWADYPSLGVDAQALYVTANMFRFDGNFQYAKIRVIPKAGPYAGGTVPFRDLVRMRNEDGSFAFTIQPCHTYGAPQVEYLINSTYPTTTNPTRNRLSLWSLTNPLATSPTLTRRSIATDPFGLPPDAEQQGGGTPLDTGDVRMLNAVCRGGSVWSALTTSHNWGGATNAAAAHWFQVNPVSGALVQQGIYGARRRNYYYPAVMPDSNGNMTMVFCRSGPSEFASIHYTGRAAADPLGKLQPSALLKSGATSYVAFDSFGRNRWGDYNGIAADPVDGRMVWFFSGYAAGSNAWATWVGGSRF